MAWLFLVMLLSGLFLTFYYQPDAAESWGTDAESAAGFGTANLVRLLHRIAALCFLAVSAIAAVVGLMKDDKAPVQVGTLRRGAMILIPALALACVYTGFLLPWDLLALDSVTVGAGMSGYKSLFGDEVKFVLLASGVQGVEFIRNTLLVHLGAAVVIACGLFLRPGRQARKSATSPGADSKAKSTPEALLDDPEVHFVKY